MPHTLKDLQALLSDIYTTTQGCCQSTIRSSEYVYVADEDLGSLADEERDMYSWNKQINYWGDSSFDWTYQFNIIKSANLVLDGLLKFDVNNTEVKYIKAQAHFFRALAYFNLAQIFCKPYIKENAATDLGLPLRYTSDVNHLESRSNLDQVYKMVLSDLEIAKNDLPIQPKDIYHTSKTASFALLAKVHLIMQEYNLAKNYADSVLKYKPDLMNFNNSALVSTSIPYRFLAEGKGNPEIIFFASALRSGTYFEVSYLGNIVQVSPSFYDSYSSDDLRKMYFFGQSGSYTNFAGSYSGTNDVFQGLSTNEFYFIRSECHARLNNHALARQDLNLLLKNRYSTDKAPNITEDNQEALLRIILAEKVKEFPRIANIWWEDIRRLNLDPRFQKTLTRTVNGQIFTLPPNDPRYVFPIPMNEIKFSNIEQNQR